MHEAYDGNTLLSILRSSLLPCFSSRFSSSPSESKWSSMARLDDPVMNTRRRAPADRASSTAYWISGLSTMGSISLGLALVAGRKRVPRPATGNTATSTRLFFMAAPALFGGQNHTTPPFPALQASDPGARE